MKGRFEPSAFFATSAGGRHSRARAGLLAAGAMAVLATGYVAAQGQRQGASAPITIQKQGSFAVGGKILGDPNATSLHCDHGYVDYQIPVNPRRINLVMWHSAAATAWLNRWDGGEGYQSIFLRRGYPVYIWDGPQRRPRQLGLRGTHLPAGHRPGSGELHRLAVRRAVPELVRGRAVPDEGPRGVEPGVARALPRVRHGRKRAAAVGCRGEADGQDRSERRAHQFRRRHARHPDGAQDEQPGRHRDVRERRLRLSAG